MELHDIENKLNMLLTGSGRKIVFWYDEDAEYEEDIQNIHLADGAKTWILTQNNWFETKLMLEVRDKESNYLIYAPFPRPEDKENLLADTFYYSEHFYSDKMVQLCGDLGIPVECQDEVKRFKKFWTAGNTEKFKKLNVGDYTVASIDLGMLCVIGGVKTCNFEELLRKVLLAGLDDNTILKKIVTQKMDSIFWKLCEKQYGYKDSDPTLQKLLVTLLVTYTDAMTDGNIPKEWKSFISGKQNDVIVFVKNLMNHTETRDFYDLESEKIAVRLEVKKLLRQISLDNVVALDTFELFDENIIQWIIAKIEDGMLDEKIAGMTIPEICEARMKNCYHFSEKYESYYQMLKNGYLMLKGISSYSLHSKFEDVIQEYVDSTYLIDSCYRKFYFYLDRIGLNENFEKIRDLIENTYTNKYLADCVFKWNQCLSEEVYRTYTGTRQLDFYNRYVLPFMRESGRAGRVIVIISDALRYECAKELHNNLELDEKCDSKIGHVLSVLPSETTLGMAALLPHKIIQMNENMNVTVDELKCGNSLEERRKILKAKNPKSDCFDFDTMMNAKQADIRSMLQDKEVVYIYQNQIDNRGENQKSENEVFNACQEAIEQIQMLIRRLTGYVSATRFLITADHGFIYKRDKLSESDKISLDKSGISFVNKRFLISKEKIENDAVSSRAMTYLDRLSSLYVSTPIGADIIKTPGGGQNYVHGGSSPQEMIVPVIKVVTFKGLQETSMVNVELSYGSNRITDIMVYLDFMQMDAVTDTLKPRKLLAYFVDEMGEKISYDVPVIANSTEKDPRHRLMREKFILKSGNYSRGKDYYLVLADMEDPTKEHQRYKFEIDIAGI